MPLAQRFLQQMGLTGDEIQPATLEQLARASRGSLREFGCAVATLGIANGGNIN